MIVSDVFDIWLPVKRFGHVMALVEREEMDIKVCERFLGTKRKQCILDDDKKQAPKDDDVEGKQKMLRLMRKIDQDHGYENPEDPESLQEDS